MKDFSVWVDRPTLHPGQAFRFQVVVPWTLFSAMRPTGREKYSATLRVAVRARAAYIE